MTVHIYRTRGGTIVKHKQAYYRLTEPAWDQLFSQDDLSRFLTDRIKHLSPLEDFDPGDGDLLAPIGGQEVWAAGVTYYYSREARAEESEAAQGADFYHRVYNAERPELFLKATPHRVVGHGQTVRIRRDSDWNVPEPELTLAISPTGKIFGYTIGNDVSSRDIEGENPLYLPQAKLYSQSCALGPGILLTDEPLADTTLIAMEIGREGKKVFDGSVPLSQLKRTPQSLVHYLFRDNEFPMGCFLLTGTGVIPPKSFTLQSGDEVQITIEPIGILINKVDQDGKTKGI
ncbi:MAG: fumarylacetoacetate hydrolase family protein [Acidobacteriota bacterium]